MRHKISVDYNLPLSAEKNGTVWMRWSRMAVCFPHPVIVFFVWMCVRCSEWLTAGPAKPLLPVHTEEALWGRGPALARELPGCNTLSAPSGSTPPSTTQRITSLLTKVLTFQCATMLGTPDFYPWLFYSFSYSFLPSSHHCQTSVFIHIVCAHMHQSILHIALTLL